MATLAAAIIAVIAIDGAFSFWQEWRQRAYVVPFDLRQVRAAA